MVPFVIGIAGGSGAGKTTIARALAAELAPAAVVELDWYYHDLGGLPPEERAEANFDHPDALEWPLLRDHLAALKRSESIRRPLYDFATHSRLRRTLELAPEPVILVEGILALHHPDVRALMDLSVFVDAAPTLRLTRRIRRDVTERGRSPASVLSQFDRTVDPMHQRFVEPGRILADLHVDGNAPVETSLAAIRAARYR